jgi:hypothetical protein
MAIFDPLVLRDISFFFAVIVHLQSKTLNPYKAEQHRQFTSDSFPTNKNRGS